jgi:hypothetical protein
VSNYVKNTDYAVKDGLLTGNPNKIIKGTELDEEFNDIAVAISTKADLVSPTFTGTPAAPTASPGTNTTQLATTAFVAAAIAATKEALYPVGSIYTNATNNTNPGTLLGFGTWVAFGAGRVMVGHNASDPLFDTAEETGGSKDAIVVSHTHTATSTVTDPGHRHRQYFSGTAGTDAGSTQTNSFQGYNFNNFVQATEPNSSFSGLNTTGISVATSVASAGSSATNANLQPYITVYMWKRTV